MDQYLSEISDKEIKEFHQYIGTRVKHYRESREISQLQMALSLGIKSVAFYSNCENNKQGKHFNVEHLYKICKVLDVSLSEFFQEPLPSK
jgi:transcriptional regulator with XRE-family HTH domain